eukprot:scaffold2072_cov207-Chaetoceros_neogracile.AAC.2
MNNNSIRNLEQSGSDTQGDHSSNWNNTEGIMTRISRVLFPAENELASPVKPRRSRLHTTICDSLVNLKPAPNGSPNKKTTSTAIKKKNLIAEGVSENCGKGRIASRSRRGQSKDTKRDGTRKNHRNESRTRGSSRRVTMEEGSVLSNLPLLQNVTQEIKIKNASKKAAARRGRRASRRKENIDASAGGDTKWCDVVENKVPSRCARYSTSVFENLPTQEAPPRISLRESVQVTNSSSSATSPPSDMIKVVHYEIPCSNYDDECIISPSMAPRALKRCDLKDTPVFAHTQATEHTEQLLHRKQKLNIENEFISPSMAPRASKRLDNRSTPALDDSDETGIITVPDSTPINACRQYDSGIVDTPGNVPERGSDLDTNVLGMQSKEELLLSSREDEVSDQDGTKEGGFKPTKHLDQTEKRSKHEDLEENPEITITVAVPNDVANTPVLMLDLGTSDTCAQRRKSLRVGTGSRCPDTEYVTENKAQVAVSADTAVSLVPPSEGSIELSKCEQKAGNKSSYFGIRRSNRNSRPVDRFIATFKRKRKRKNQRALETSRQSQAKEKGTAPKTCTTISCKKKMADQDVLPVKPSEAKLRRSARTSEPTKRFTILSFGKKKKSTRKVEKERYHERDALDEKNCAKEGHKSIHKLDESIHKLDEVDESKKINENESDSEDDIFKATPFVLGHSTDLSVHTNAKSNIDLIPRNDRKKKGVRRDKESSNGWTEDLLNLLRQSHSDAEPMSLSFWQDVADKIGGKSDQECRDKWFSLADSPAAHRHKQAFDQESSCEIDDDEDDIFNSTPAKMVRAEEMITSLYQKGSSRAKPLKRLSDLFSSPLINRRKKLQSPLLAKSPLFFRPNYKTYLKEVRNGINEK